MCLFVLEPLDFRKSNVRHVPERITFYRHLLPCPWTKDSLLPCMFDILSLIAGHQEEVDIYNVLSNDKSDLHGSTIHRPYRLLLQNSCCLLLK